MWGEVEHFSFSDSWFILDSKREVTTGHAYCGFRGVIKPQDQLVLSNNFVQRSSSFRFFSRLTMSMNYYYTSSLLSTLVKRRQVTRAREGRHP